MCFGCNSNAWNKALLPWNAQRIEPEGPDLDMLVCGECMYRYKYVRDFCPCCFKPYVTEESMLPLLPLDPTHANSTVVAAPAIATATVPEPVLDSVVGNGVEVENDNKDAQLMEVDEVVETPAAAVALSDQAATDINPMASIVEETNVINSDTAAVEEKTCEADDTEGSNSMQIVDQDISVESTGAAEVHADVAKNIPMLSEDSMVSKGNLTNAVFSFGYV